MVKLVKTCFLFLLPKVKCETIEIRQHFLDPCLTYTCPNFAVCDTTNSTEYGGQGLFGQFWPAIALTNLVWTNLRSSEILITVANTASTVCSKIVIFFLLSLKRKWYWDLIKGRLELGVSLPDGPGHERRWTGFELMMMLILGADN